MSDTLRDDLMEISGIGEATADKILEILDENDIGASAPDDVVELLEEAVDHFQESNRADVTAQQGIVRVEQAFELLQEDDDDD